MAARKEAASPARGDWLASACRETKAGDILKDFQARGEHWIRGASYYDEPREGKRDKQSTSTKVGVSYCITSLAKIDAVEETFSFEMNLNFRYKIKEEDVEEYKRLQQEGNIDDLQDVVDSQKIQVTPPLLEVMNCTEQEFKHWRIIGVSKCLDPDIAVDRCQAGPKWCWFVTTYCQLQAVCQEPFELQKFPFTRQALQIHIQCKQSMDTLLFVPFQEPTWQPTLKIDAITRELKDIQPRLNSMNCSTELGTWDVENHHIAFPPADYLAALGSGRKYSKFIVTMQCKQSPDFFLWNTVPVIMLMPLLAAMALLEPIANVADRSSIVFAMLLTMATYKVSLTAWMPQKKYLTYLDWYVLTGFVFILLIGFVVAVSALIHVGGAQDDGRRLAPQSGKSFVEQFYFGDPVNMVERWFVSFLVVVWLLAHLLFVCTWHRGEICRDWATVMRSENQKMKALAVDVQDHAQEQRERLSELLQTVNHDLRKRLNFQGNKVPEFEEQLPLMAPATLTKEGAGSMVAIASKYLDIDRVDSLSSQFVDTQLPCAISDSHLWSECCQRRLSFGSGGSVGSTSRPSSASALRPVAADGASGQPSPPPGAPPQLEVVDKQVPARCLSGAPAPLQAPSWQPLSAVAAPRELPPEGRRNHLAVPPGVSPGAPPGMLGAPPGAPTEGQAAAATHSGRSGPPTDFAPPGALSSGRSQGSSKRLKQEALQQEQRRNG